MDPLTAERPQDIKSAEIRKVQVKNNRIEAAPPAWVSPSRPLRVQTQRWRVFLQALLE